jgi:SAM-dependent methyltransferase
MDLPPPASWLAEHVDLIPPPGRVLDVACGRGRNGVWLAMRGFHVHAIDRDADALQALERTARAVAPAGALTTARVDLEGDTPVLGVEAYDAVIVFNYLHRPLMPKLVDAVAPRGVLIYETFTEGQAARGRPTNPHFLLRAGELPTLVAPLRVLRAREGDVDGRLVASVVAIRG